MRKILLWVVAVVILICGVVALLYPDKAAMRMTVTGLINERRIPGWESPVKKLLIMRMTRGAFSNGRVRPQWEKDFSAAAESEGAECRHLQDRNFLLRYEKTRLIYFELQPSGEISVIGTGYADFLR